MMHTFREIKKRVYNSVKNTKLFKELKSYLHFNSSRFHLKEFLQEAADTLGPEQKVLDAGSGEGFYSSLFTHTGYESTDFCGVDKTYGDITFICNLENIPIPAERYDAVLLTQVIEHLPNPSDVLDEIHRILKPTGKLWLTGPLFFPEHEAPYDFYRYTRYGLEHLLSRAGFQIVDLQPLEGYGATFSYQLKMAVKELPQNPTEYGGKVRGILVSILLLFMKPWFLLLSKMLDTSDKANKITNVGMCKNYRLIAVKSDRRLN